MSNAYYFCYKMHHKVKVFNYEMSHDASLVSVNNMTL